MLCLNKAGADSPALLESCQRMLGQFGLVAPVLVIDARRRGDVVRMFEMLFLLLEQGSVRIEVDRRCRHGTRRS